MMSYKSRESSLFEFVGLCERNVAYDAVMGNWFCAISLKTKELILVCAASIIAISLGIVEGMMLMT
jgi:hypothetical protein